MRKTRSEGGETSSADIRPPMADRSEGRFDFSEKRKRRPVYMIIAAIAVIFIISGIVLLIRRPVIEKQRTDSARNMIRNIKLGQETVIVDSDDFAVEGEGYEFFEEEEITVEDPLTPLDPDAAVFTLPDKVTLTAVGTLEIESVGIDLPLWDDAGIVPLRYGAGVYKESVMPGEEGNLVVLGHRMKTYGSIFNRLGEVVIGDEAVIVTMDGNRYTYVVDEIIEALDPNKLPDYLTQENSEGAQLTLVTCTPTGVGSHRLLVIGHLAGS